MQQLIKEQIPLKIYNLKRDDFTNGYNVYEIARRAKFLTVR